MKILFLTLSKAIRDISNRGIYPDLMRKFKNEGHELYIVCPVERKEGKETYLVEEGNLHTLCVKTLNITKTNIVEKGVATILIESQFQKAIKKHFKAVVFDLVIYSTPPISFNSIIERIKKEHGCQSYLMLKDIFPQNALDLGIMSKKNPMYWSFRKKEEKLYAISDHIGCMSPANIDFVLEHNPSVDKSKMEICPNSVEPLTEKTIDKAFKDQVRAQYDIPSDSVVCMYGGNLGKPQGIDFLIEILKANSQLENAFFVVAGNGTEFAKLKRYQETHASSNFLLIPSLPKKDYDELLAACDVGLILLDKRFTIPNYPSRLLNYMELKLPILFSTDEATDAGSIAEENNYGLWSMHGDLEKFNAILEKLVSNFELRKTMGQNAYQYLMNHYTVDKTYNAIMKHFKNN